MFSLKQGIRQDKKDHEGLRIASVPLCCGGSGAEAMVTCLAGDSIRASTQRAGRIIHFLKKIKSHSNYNVFQYYREGLILYKRQVAFPLIIRKGIVKEYTRDEKRFVEIVGYAIANLLVEREDEMSHNSFFTTKAGKIRPYVKFLKNSVRYDKEEILSSAEAFAISYILGDHDGHYNNVRIVRNKLVRIDWGLALNTRVSPHYILQRAIIHNQPYFCHLFDDQDFSHKIDDIVNIVLCRGEVIVDLIRDAIKIFSELYNYGLKKYSLFLFRESIEDRDVLARRIYSQILYRNAVEVKFISFAIEIFNVMIEGSITLSDKLNSIDEIFVQINKFKRDTIGIDEESLDKMQKNSFTILGFLLEKYGLSKKRDIDVIIRLLSADKRIVIKQAISNGIVIDKARVDFYMQSKDYHVERRVENFEKMMESTPNLPYIRGLIENTTYVWGENSKHNNFGLWQDKLLQHRERSRSLDF